MGWRKNWRGVEEGGQGTTRPRPTLCRSNTPQTNCNDCQNSDLPIYTAMWLETSFTLHFNINILSLSLLSVLWCTATYSDVSTVQLLWFSSSASVFAVVDTDTFSFIKHCLYLISNCKKPIKIINKLGANLSTENQHDGLAWVGRDVAEITLNIF